MSQKIINHKLALLPGGNKNNDGFQGRALQNGEVGGIWHDDHQGGEMGDGEGLKMYIHIKGTGTSNKISTQPSRSNRRWIPWWEVKDHVRRCTHPLAQISGIHERDSASDYARLIFCLHRDITCVGDDDLIDGSHFTADRLMRCSNKKTDVLDVFALSLLPWKDIPLLIKWEKDWK